MLGWDPHDRLVDYLDTRSRKASGGMRFGYWMPVFGGWLRNIPDEGMEASWDYMKRLTQRSEETGWDLTLIAELNLNDIKGVEQPALDAWSTAAALAAVTRAIELMVAVRPNFHQPALFAKAAANIDKSRTAGWRSTSSRPGGPTRRRNTACSSTSTTTATPAPTEWLQVVDGLWTQERFSFDGERYKLDDAICEPKPVRKPRPTIYAGGESEAAKTMIATLCDAYVMHGDPVDAIKRKIADMEERRARAGKGRMQYGMAAFAIVRDSEAEAKRELERITQMPPTPPKGFDNFDQWLSGTQLERELKLQEYSVSNRGLRPNFVGTPEQLQERIEEYEAAGLDLLLLQMSPQAEEMDRFAAR